MSHTLNKRLILLCVLLVIYNFFFWGERLGINLVLFTLFSAAALVILNTDCVKLNLARFAFAAIIYSGALVLYHNSVFSKFSLFSSFAVFTGVVHQKEIRTAFSALFTSLISLFLFPYNLIEGSRRGSGKYKVLRFTFKAMRLAVLPFIVFVVFYALYAHANPLFNSYSVTFWDTINDFIYGLLKDYPIERFLYILLGMVIIMGFLYNNNISAFRDFDNIFLNRLLRDPVKKLAFRITSQKYVPLIVRSGLITPKNNSLISEYRIGIILLVMVNVLILILNLLDIRFLWFGFDARQVDNLAYYVHEGTYVLIFSILLSMAILLYLFRGNINFYSRSRSIKILAYGWILQNAVMAISVSLRNIYYIEYYYALSYKRIGVMVFLLLTVIGLVTMLMKILGKRTTFNIVKLNSWAVFAVMLLISSFSWDKAIVEYNLKNPNKDAIDIQYLLSLSDETLPVLAMHKDILDRDYLKDRYTMDDDKNGLEEFEKKKFRFLNEYTEHSWLSWNYPDYNTYKELGQIQENTNRREPDPLNY